MASVANPRGLRAINSGIAGTSPRLTEYTMTASKTVYEGEVVQLASTGLVTKVTLATGGAHLNLLGVAAHYVAATATTAYKVLVYDDPNQIYVVDSPMAAASNVQTLIGQRAFITNNSAGNGTTLQCKGAIASSTSTGTNQVVKIIGFYNQIGNVIGTTNADFLVQILPRNHVFATSTGV